jgi:hypothetical protein
MRNFVMFDRPMCTAMLSAFFPMAAKAVIDM